MTSKRCLLAAVLLLFAGEAIAAYTVNGQRKSFEIYRTDSPPVIDGRLDDACWRDAEWTDDFEDIEGDAKPRPRFRTRAKS